MLLATGLFACSFDIPVDSHDDNGPARASSTFPSKR
uniref:Uncharacterized protein n=1 Tax=Anopheles albimanus TaxID=7167 RepID=A0A182FXQ2_ANOAL